MITMLLMMRMIITDKSDYPGEIRDVANISWASRPCCLLDMLSSLHTLSRCRRPHSDIVSILSLT